MRNDPISARKHPGHNKKILCRRERTRIDKEVERADEGEKKSIYFLRILYYITLYITIMCY